MALYVYDAAYEPNLTACKNAGGIAIARYFVGNDSTYQWKRVTPTQVQQIRAAGLGVVVNYEGTADPIGQAQSQGISLRTYGQQAANAALVDIKACGVPQDGTVACYFSLDNNYSAGVESAVSAYFQGIHDVMDPAKIQVKVYAEGLMIDFLVSKGLVVGKQWLAAPTSWPNFNSNDANVCMVQLVGSPVSGTDQDLVHSVTDAQAIAAWWPPNSPYNTDPNGDLMSFADGSNYASKSDFEAAIRAQVGNASLTPSIVTDSTGKLLATQPVYDLSTALGNAIVLLWGNTPNLAPGSVVAHRDEVATEVAAAQAAILAAVKVADTDVKTTDTDVKANAAALVNVVTALGDLKTEVDALKAGGVDVAALTTALKAAFAAIGNAP